MAEGLPLNFNIPNEGAIASYDWVDIASGTGYITYYLGLIDGGKVATNQRFYSDVGSANASIDVAVNTVVIDYDFDALMNKPTTLQGKAIFNVPCKLSGVTNAKVRVDCYIRKWANSTETEIASAQGTEIDFGTSPYVTHKEGIGGGIITVPLTKFKKGEYLRITIQIVVTDPKVDNINVGFDPMDVGYDNVGWDLITSTSTVQIPVRIDL